MYKFVHCKLHVSSIRADEQSTPRALGAYAIIVAELQSWNDDTSNILLASTTSEEEICASMSVLASCVSTNEKSSFYSTHLQVRFTTVSENRSAAISIHGRHLSFYRNT